MKKNILLLCVLCCAFAADAQRRITIHNTNKTKGYYYLPAVDSISFNDTLLVPVAGGMFSFLNIDASISSFWIDKYEVTFELWTSVRAWGLTHGYNDLPAGQNGYNPTGVNHPVTMVNWYDIVKWCNARSEKEGLAPVYFSDVSQTTIYQTGEIDINNANVKWNANGYRLPTEAEWMYAAGGGLYRGKYMFSGSDTCTVVGWCVDNAGGRTNTIGTKLPNQLGTYDMSGNVWEWCWDWFINPALHETVDPKGPSTTQTYRMVTSGSFRVQTIYCRVTYEKWNAPSYRSDELGFRCVQD